MDLRKNATLTDAIEWARQADAGEYLSKYADRPTDEDDGSRCGWGDDELAEIETALARRKLRLDADDVGLIAVALW